MAVVSNTEVFIANKRYRRIVKCGSDGKFTCALPPAVAVMGRVKEAEGKTLQECIAAWGSIIEKQKEEHTTVVKVIIYAVGESRFCDGASVSLQVAVFEESIHQLSGSQRITYKCIESSLPEDAEKGAVDLARGIYSERVKKAIDWTVEREAFFKRLADALILIRDELGCLNDKDAAVVLIDSGRFRLMGGGEGRA